MRLPQILVVARAEMRSDRRLIRYWLFVLVSVLASFGMYGQYAFLHGMFSNMSATVGSIGPRYLIGSIGVTVIMISLVGLIFLAFDIRARDERDRMTEVLDTRPLSNLEFIVGKVTGLVFMIWIPLVIVSLILQVVGLIAVVFDFPMGEPIEPYSVVGFLVASLTSLFLWCSIIVLLAAVIRYRLLIAIVTLGLLGLQFWLSFNMPVYQAEWFSIMPTSDFGSDILPAVWSEGSGIRIAAHWTMAAGLLFLAVALHPRRDGNTMARVLGVSAGLLTLSMLVLGSYIWQRNGLIEQQNVWRVAHTAKQNVPRVDLQAITGSLKIQPGDELSMELDLMIRNPLDQALPTLLFTLNPGVSVAKLDIEGREVTWVHENGLLEITPVSSLAPGETLTINLMAAGVPYEYFGYLDSSTNVMEADLVKSQLAILGTKVSIFESTYVAMTPGGHWLPSSGTDLPQSDPRTHPPDYYTIDLEVEIPSGWLVAGPGRRMEISSDSDETARFRFGPRAPVPHIGLLASRFERRMIETAGIEFEALFYPAHDRNLKFFEESENAIRERLTEMFTAARELGLPYPYDGMSLVETPNVLRAYGGGWRMDTVQTMPGVMMLRESSFPTARFEVKFKREGDAGVNLSALLFDEDAGETKLVVIERFFENDFNGGNLFTGGSRNFLHFQTSAMGEGALAINFVLDELTALLLTDKRGFFSAHEFSSSINLIMGETIQDIAQGRTDSVAESIQRTITNRPSVWDRALGASLAALEPNDDPRRSLSVLALKSEAIARVILDGLGREKTGALLSALVNQYRGRHFHAADLYQIAADHDIELEPLVGDWLHDSSLPGFLVSSVESVRLTDDSQGNPRYQTRLHVRNDESTPGLVRFSFQWGSKKKRIWDATEPIRVPANSSVEVGISTLTPLGELWLKPYLSLNRHDVKLRVPKVDSEARLNTEILVGARPSDWKPRKTADIVVDDLDSGFSVRSEREGEAISIEISIGSPFSDEVADMDQGLPEYKSIYGTAEAWSRSVYEDSWGKYRHTHALVTSGAGDQHAAFSTELPHEGRWRLSYYLALSPEQKAKKGEEAEGAATGRLTASVLGEYQMNLISNGDNQKIEFDGKAAASGWNDLGEFQLPAGEISLEVSNANTGFIVIADAIRWRPSTLGK